MGDDRYQQKVSYIERTERNENIMRALPTPQIAVL
jgi:hypothetical protein